MINTILGTKGKMSQAFIEGYRVPVTKIVAGPCFVTQIKREEKDGYWALQLGFGTRKVKNTSKPLQGHFKKIQNSKVKIQNYPRYLREVRLEKEPEVKVGDEIKVSDIFTVGDKIAVTGTSKGKGFAGVVKRHHFKGGPRTHGQSDRERAPGSIGQTTTPGRVYKGKKMAGRMGRKRIMIKNLHIVSLDPEKNEVLVSGPVPGAPGSLLTLKRLAKGSLKELEHETVQQVVVEEEEAKEETASVPPSGTTASQEGDKNA